MIFGRWPAKPVSVIWERADDPKEMMKGMEEYFFKSTQAMSFGDKKSLEEQIQQAVIVEDSMNYKIFNHNLKRLVEEEMKRQNLSVHPADRVNHDLEERKEREAKEALRIA